jgi:hypothetical protein
VFTRARHWSLFCAKWIQSIPPHPIFVRPSWPSPGAKAAGAWSWPLQLVQRSRKVDLYIHPPICLLGRCA